MADPASPIGTPTLLGADSLAYLTFRKVNDQFEFGAYGHGPHGIGLAERVVGQVRLWDDDHRRGEPASITVYPASEIPPARSGERVIRKRHTTVSICWP